MKEILIRMEGHSYAIDSSNLVEIVPLVQLDPAVRKNNLVAGDMVYRGERLPVIDLCMMSLGRPHRKKFSTRILIVQLENRMIGLIAEDLTDLNSASDAPLAQKLDLQVLAAQCL